MAEIMNPARFYDDMVDLAISESEATILVTD